MAEETQAEGKETKAGATDARPYEETLWREGQEVYFKLLELAARRARADAQLARQARDFCARADAALRANLDDLDDFVQRVMVSETFYSESARVKKTEIYLKQLYFRKCRIEELLRELGA